LFSFQEEIVDDSGGVLDLQEYLDDDILSRDERRILLEENMNNNINSSRHSSSSSFINSKATPSDGSINPSVLFDLNSVKKKKKNRKGNLPMEMNHFLSYINTAEGVLKEEEGLVCVLLFLVIIVII
jgi:hypothetical protein